MPTINTYILLSYPRWIQTLIAAHSHRKSTGLFPAVNTSYHRGSTVANIEWNLGGKEDIMVSVSRTAERNGFTIGAGHSRSVTSTLQPFELLSADNYSSLVFISAAVSAEATICPLEWVEKTTECSQSSSSVFPCLPSCSHLRARVRPSTSRPKTISFSSLSPHVFCLVSTLCNLREADCWEFTSKSLRFMLRTTGLILYQMNAIWQTHQRGESSYERDFSCDEEEEEEERMSA